jgi:peptidoglycan/LPS O-acetylase OafA/YrhL
MNISIGMLLADLHIHYSKSATSLLPPIVPLAMIIVGTFFACFPQDAPESAAWSDLMRRIMFVITPMGADLRRYWDSIGASLIIFGIFFSTHARRVLASPFCNFLGRVSFPVYLLHNQFIKTVLTWMVYLPAAWTAGPAKLDADGNIVVEMLKRGSDLHVFAAVVVYFYLLYKAAWLWTLCIDPAIARLVRWGVRLAYGEGLQTEKVNLLG